MQTTALLAGVENHRVGRVAGDDGLAKIVRTFHARFGSVKMGGGQTARDRLAYVFREGKHKSDAADVESSAGDKEALLRDADRIKASARVRRGPTAERILATQIVELPAESTAEQRKACAEAFVADWKARGHEAVAVVHMHGEEGPQPHLHVEVAARAVGRGRRRGPQHGAVDRPAWTAGRPGRAAAERGPRQPDVRSRPALSPRQLPRHRHRASGQEADPAKALPRGGGPGAARSARTSVRRSTRRALSVTRGE